MGMHADPNYKRKWYERNKERILNKRKEYYQQNKDLILRNHQKYYQDHQEDCDKRHTRWINDNYYKFVEWRRKYDRENKRKENRLPVLKEHRRILRRVLTGVQKNLKPEYLIGCDINTFKKHLEKTAPIGFSWNKVCGFEIDHIVPCAQFNLNCLFHRKLCFHFSNIHIMTKEEHMDKHYHLRREHRDVVKQY